MSSTAQTDPQPRRRSGRTVAASQAFRKAGGFDRAKVSARAGLIAAIPVAAMLSLGIAVGSPAAAVTMGVGAMFPGIAWRAGDAPTVPPIGTMAGASIALATAGLAGMLSGRWPWVHLLLLVIICLFWGLASSLGRRGLVIGTQSLIGFIVFGRFPQDVPQALALTGLVLAGGAAQVLFAEAVAVPLAWRRQRAALAAAYRTLAEFTAEVAPSGLPAGKALDTADQVLAAPALFADPDRGVLADLVAQGRRLRLELISFGALLANTRRTQPDLAEASSEGVREALDRLRQLLAETVAAIEGDAATLAALPTDAAALREWGVTREPLPATLLDQRLAALIGQVTAAARLAAALGAPDRGSAAIPTGRPSRGTRRIRRQIASDAQRMRNAATLDSAAGRHALRLAVVVPFTELLVQRAGLPRGYWAVVAAATVLRPGFGQTFTRGAERVLGTCAGVVIATLIAVALDPSDWGAVAVVAVFAYFTYAVFPASFTAGVALLTAVIVFMLHAVAPDTTQTALDRGIDTAIGGAIGLIAYALWPTWSALSTGRLLASLVDAQHGYLDAVLTGLTTGRRVSDTQLRMLARGARVAFTDAQAAIDLASNEPRHSDADPRIASSTLSVLRRVTHGVHVLRLDAAAMPDPLPLPALAPLQAALGDALTALAAALRESDRRTFPALRTLHRELARRRPQLLSQALWAALDELVDATDTAAETVGLTVP